MGQHTIKVTITPDGKVTSEVNGIKGTTCEGAADFLNQLGAVVEDRPTGEFYEIDLNTELQTGW